MKLYLQMTNLHRFRTREMSSSESNSSLVTQASNGSRLARAEHGSYSDRPQRIRNRRCGLCEWDDELIDEVLDVDVGGAFFHFTPGRNMSRQARPKLLLLLTMALLPALRVISCRLTVIVLIAYPGLPVSFLSCILFSIALHFLFRHLVRVMSLDTDNTTTLF